MKLAILGGSYNPIHLGHLMLADAVCKRYGYDTVAFVPAFASPFKNGHEGCSTEDRVAMVKLAIADNPAFYCETCEIDRSGISYTVDTLSFLYQKYDTRLSGTIGLIIGDDLVENFDKWYKAASIKKMSNIIVGRRYCCEGTDTRDKPLFHAVENAVLPISSTAIRKAIASGGAWRYLVHPQVYTYIKTNKLYERCID